MSPFAQTMFSGSMNLRKCFGLFHRYRFAFNVAGLAISVAVLFGYVIQVNATAASGYQIRELETAIHELTLANQQLEMNARQAQSLENVAHSVKMLGMVDGETPEYVQGSQSSYVLAE